MSKPMKKANELPQFTGPFQELIPKYISYKRAQGYKIGNPIVYRLREMDLFFKDRGIMDIQITREMYEKWTSHKPSEKEQNIQKRRSVIRGFAQYLVSCGYPDVYTGRDDNRIFKKDFIPYVFTDEEICRIFRVLQGDCENRLGMRMMLFGWRCCCIIAAVSENPRCLIS